MQQNYKTRQRDVILAFFREHKDTCFSARQVHEALHAEDIGKTTVYRTLALLCEQGALTRFSAEHQQSATYQYASHNPACEHHLHLKCRQCGVLYHTECTRLKKLADHLEQEHGFSVSQSDTILYGVCGLCKKEAL